MPAYLLLVLAILTRVLPHHAMLNFTAVGGALLYFGARRSWREMLAPLAALMATDYFLTVYTYHYAFVWTAYVTTGRGLSRSWRSARILLKSKTSWLRVGAAVVLGPTSFWLVSNYAVWAVQSCGAACQRYVSAYPLRLDRLLCRRPCRSIATTCFPPPSSLDSHLASPCLCARPGSTASRTP